MLSVALVISPRRRGTRTCAIEFVSTWMGKEEQYYTVRGISVFSQ